MEKQIFSSGNRLKFVFFSFVVAAILLAATLSFAQLPTAKIVGTVKDSSGASVPGAMVRVTNVDTNITRTLTTGADGSYNALELPTGNYQVEVTASGFKSEIRKGITLQGSGGYLRQLRRGFDRGTDLEGGSVKPSLLGT